MFLLKNFIFMPMELLNGLPIVQKFAVAAHLIVRMLLILCRLSSLQNPLKRMILPPVDITDDPDADKYLQPGDTYVLHHFSHDQLRILWHQRLGHIHSRRIAKMHRHADGIPKVPIATELDTCPICAQAKLRKVARGKEDSRRATQCYQGLSIDFGFMVQRMSADSCWLYESFARFQ